jgi:hypothetical protein
MRSWFLRYVVTIAIALPMASAAPDITAHVLRHCGQPPVASVDH